MNPGHDATSGSFDVLVVGGGSAGCVLARRLSESGDRRVLLLEAGPHRLTDPAMVRAVRDANQPAVVPGINWKYRTFIKGGGMSAAPAPQRAGSADASPRATPGGLASMFDYEAGRLLGGSSAVNAVQALRGMPGDYDDWGAECGEEWSWSAVLPFFRKLEDDPLGPNELHGSGGPMPVRRERKEDLTPLQAGLMEACIAHGFSETTDHNDPGTSGVGIIPKNVVDGVRVSAAMAYLDRAPAVANLTILTQVLVHRLWWRNNSCCGGVEAEIDGTVKRFSADTVVICAGAVATPTLLMRSGIGDPSVLDPVGVPVRVKLPGVGENLMDHPVIGVWGAPVPGACRLGEPLRQTLLRYSSTGPGGTDDMHVCMMAGINAAKTFPHLNAASNALIVAGVTACFNRSTSRGRVRLKSADPLDPPQVWFNCLGEATDIPPLKEGVRLVWDLLQHIALRSRFERMFAWTDGMIRSDVALERAVTTFVRPSAHACGSARMGRSPEAGAVVDPRGRVFGVDNLWIADASIMPAIPSAPTHLSCLMAAEKIAVELARAR